MSDPKTKGILILVLNIIIPGVGTMIYGETTRGIIQLVLYIGGIVLSCIFVGIFLAVGAWIWAIIDGIKYYKELTAQAESGGGDAGGGGDEGGSSGD